MKKLYKLLTQAWRRVIAKIKFYFYLEKKSPMTFDGLAKTCLFWCCLVKCSNCWKKLRKHQKRERERIPSLKPRKQVIPNGTPHCLSYFFWDAIGQREFFLSLSVFVYFLFLSLCCSCFSFCIKSIETLYLSKFFIFEVYTYFSFCVCFCVRVSSFLVVFLILSLPRYRGSKLFQS